MKPSEILRKAARRVERGRGGCGCDAIARVASRSVFGIPPENVMAWFRLVGPRNPDPDETWWGRTGFFTGGASSYNNPENMNARIIGLCLAAAIAESEGQ